MSDARCGLLFGGLSARHWKGGRAMAQCKSCDVTKVDDFSSGAWVCDDCAFIEYLRETQTIPHKYYQPANSSHVVCEVCKLLPDAEDYYTDCEGRDGNE